MLISISASQGQGKTTLLRRLGESFKIVDLQTQRTILSKMRRTLTEVNADPQLKMHVQEVVLETHIEACEKIRRESNYDEPVFVERSFSDIFAYTLPVIGAFNRHDAWLHEYREKCANAQRELFNGNIFLTGREYVPEDDGVRSTSTDYATMIDRTIQHYTKRWARPYTVGGPVLLELDEPSLEERELYVVKWLEERIDELR